MVGFECESGSGAAKVSLLRLLTQKTTTLRILGRVRVLCITCITCITYHASTVKLSDTQSQNTTQNLDLVGAYVFQLTGASVVVFESPSRAVK